MPASVLLPALDMGETEPTNSRSAGNAGTWREGSGWHLEPRPYGDLETRLKQRKLGEGRSADQSRKAFQRAHLL